MVFAIRPALLEIYFRHTISKGVYHACLSYLCRHDGIRTVGMDVSVNMKGWLKNPDKPKKSFNAAVGQIGLIMHPTGG